MENNVKVSVIMPIYNAFDYIRPALDTVLDQTLREIEVICIDDGSTDKSLSVIKEYQEHDARIRIVTENNAGVSVARNKGIIRARGEFIIFLDADDFYEPTLIEALYEAAVRDELDIAMAGFDVFNNRKSSFTLGAVEEHGDIFAKGNVVSKSEYPDYILQSVTGYIWNKLFRTSFIREKELLFAPELYVFEDVHFVCAALSMATRVKRIDDVLVHHRVYSDQSRQKLFRKYYAQVPVVYMKIKEFLASRGVYVPLAISYLNLSASRCYKIYNLLWNDAKASFWDLLHDGYAQSFGWYQHEPCDFESKEIYDFAANVGLYSHSQYTKRLDKGVALNIDKITKESLNRRIKSSISNAKIVAKIKSLLSRFKKKNRAD